MASRRCLYCETPLPPRRRKWCSPRCRWRAHHPDWVYHGEPDWVKKYPDSHAVAWLCEALVVDGAHHKQWYIVQALKALLGDDWALSVLDELGCEPGIAP